MTVNAPAETPPTAANSSAMNAQWLQIMRYIPHCIFVLVSCRELASASSLPAVNITQLTASHPSLTCGGSPSNIAVDAELRSAGEQFNIIVRVSLGVYYYEPVKNRVIIKKPIQEAKITGTAPVTIRFIVECDPRTVEGKVSLATAVIGATPGVSFRQAIDPRTDLLEIILKKP